MNHQLLVKVLECNVWREISDWAYVASRFFVFFCFVFRQTRGLSLFWWWRRQRRRFLLCVVWVSRLRLYCVFVYRYDYLYAILELTCLKWEGGEGVEFFKWKIREVRLRLLSLESKYGKFHPFTCSPLPPLDSSILIINTIEWVFISKKILRWFWRWKFWSVENFIHIYSPSNPPPPLHLSILIISSTSFIPFHEEDRQIEIIRIHQVKGLFTSWSALAA